MEVIAEGARWAVGLSIGFALLFAGYWLLMRLQLALGWQPPEYMVDDEDDEEEEEEEEDGWLARNTPDRAESSKESEEDLLLLMQDWDQARLDMVDEPRRRRLEVFAELLQDATLRRCLYCAPGVEPATRIHRSPNGLPYCEEHFEHMPTDELRLGRKRLHDCYRCEPE